MSYIQKIWWNMSFIVLIAGQKQSHPHGDDLSKTTKRRIHKNGNITKLKKYGCVHTCCHRNGLPQYNCVIFVKHNYNLNIPTVTNTLSKWYWEIRYKEFICKSGHKEPKDGKYSKNVQNYVSSDMVESNVNDDQNNQHNVQEKRTHNENTIISDIWANYTSQSTTLTDYYLFTCCHKTNIPRSQCIIFKASKYNLLKAPSPIHEHQNSTGHITSVENFKIIGREDHNMARAVKEAIYIRVNNLTLNRNIGKYNLPCLWDGLLQSIPELKINK